MNCREIKSWLLKADSVESASWPADIQAHVKACKSCARLAWKIRRLEDSWRDQPLPEEAEESKAAFLTKLSKMAPKKPKSTPAPAPQSRWRPLRWVALAGSMAASVLVVIGVTAALLIGFGTPPASANDDIVERLIDLNLEMTNADLNERKRILAEKKEKLAKDLAAAKLTDDDREFAEELLDNADALAAKDDPVEEAARINELAKNAQDRELVAVQKGNEKQSERCKMQFNSIYVRGILPMKERIAQSKAPEGNSKGGFQRFNELKPEQKEKLQKMFEKGPSVFPPPMGKGPSSNWGKGQYFGKGKGSGPGSSFGKGGKK